RGKVNNFKGIIYFSNGEFSSAAELFKAADAQVKLDKPLKAQVGLNLASSHYKLDNNEEAFNTLESVVPKHFGEQEKKKFYQLKLILAQTQNADKAVVSSLVYILKDKNSFSEINQSEYKSLLIDSFRKLSSSERAYLLEKNEEDGGAVVPFLAAEEA